MGQAKNRAAEINKLKANSRRLTHTRNWSGFMSGLQIMADSIVEAMPEQDYNQSDITRSAAINYVVSRNLNYSDYVKLLELREQFEDTLRDAYNVELSAGLGAFFVDNEQLLKDAGVPKNLRVASGLIDSIIGTLAMRVGAVRFG